MISTELGLDKEREGTKVVELTGNMKRNRKSKRRIE
jgi:hypothetical protein